MNWKLLFEKQIELDAYITNNHDLSESNLFEQKILALFVELGELANETRCFKFWSMKERNAKSVILEEYVDNIHFLLSLGLEKNLTFHEIEYEKNNVSETTQFNKIFDYLTRFKNEATKDNYLKLFEAYLQLADILGFTDEARSEEHTSELQSRGHLVCRLLLE